MAQVEPGSDARQLHPPLGPLPNMTSHCQTLPVESCLITCHIFDRQAVIFVLLARFSHRISVIKTLHVYSTDSGDFREVWEKHGGWALGSGGGRSVALTQRRLLYIWRSSPSALSVYSAKLQDGEEPAGLCLADSLVTPVKQKRSAQLLSCQVAQQSLFCN